jgi:S-adenosylmethionine decarboxylase
VRSVFELLPSERERLEPLALRWLREPRPAALGRHLFADLWGCAPARLDDRAFLERLAIDAVRATGATILQTCAHEFEPQGVTVVVLIAESHLALHSWPERGYLGVDYFTCGERIDPHRALAVIREALSPAHVETSEIARGRRDRG